MNRGPLVGLLMAILEPAFAKKQRCGGGLVMEERIQLVSGWWWVLVGL